VGLPFAVEGNTIIAHYTVEDGLPSSEVYFVHQDIDGYIWLCTDRGISKYDGYSFTNFTLRDGLTCATNFRIYEDPDHNLWFTGFDGSITIWDYTARAFKAFDQNAELQKELGVYNWIHTVLFKDNITEFYDFSGERTFIYNHINDEHRLVRVLKQKPRSQPAGLLQQSGGYGLLQTNRRARPFIIPINYEKDSSPMWDSDLLVRTVEEYYNTLDLSDITQLDGQLYFSTGSGLHIYESGEKVRTMFDGFGISSVTVDRENYLWVTTTSDGVYVTTRNAVGSLKNKTPFERGEKITALELFNGEPVYGTNLGRLINGHSGEILAQSGKSHDIYAIKPHNGELFLSTGLKVNTTGAQKVVSSDMAAYMILPVNDSLYLETGSNKYRYVHSDGNLSESVEFRVLDAAVLNDNTLLVSNMQNIFKTTPNYIRPRPWLTGEYKTIEQVRKIVVASQLVLLSTAGTGLYVCNKTGEVLAVLDKSDGLASDMVNSCVLDEERNRIWCATNLGVSMIDFVLEADSFRVTQLTNLNRSHGLASSYCIDLALSNDVIWVASNNDITSIPLRYSHTDVCSPAVVLEEFLCNGKELEGNHHQMSYKQNDVQLVFSGFSLQRPLNSEFYRYRLLSEESDSGWNKTNQRRISYVNLAPGDYTFEVQSKIENGDWSVSRQVHFLIEPFFLNRWSVRWVLIGLIIGAVSLLIRRRYTRIIAENKRELEFNTMQMKVNQSELDSLRGQMNPHFIFNALKSIQKFILVDDKAKANKLLTRFAKLIRSSLEFSRKDFIPLDQEVDFLTNYLEIEIQRTPDRFSYEINVETSNLDDVSIPSLMLQPICENAIKHAFVDGKGKLNITISRLEKGILLAVIEDNGVGYFNQKSKRPTHQNSLGLEIIQSRLTLLSDQGFKGNIHIEPVDRETKKGTRVKLQLPYR
jgi:ligand-binding sensor domain-containing protein/anti-sigma regulatory factor (Ser/Thr protein kinase)